MLSRIKTELAATCSTLGRLHKGEYLIEPECIESLKDIIRYLKRDKESHDIRRHLGESKVLENDLIHIIKSCPNEDSDLFDVTLRLLINLTTPTMLFFGEELPQEKTTRYIYLSLVEYSQNYKFAFSDVEFWNKICGKLTDLFEIEWTERSMDQNIQIERILMLLRNVLQVPADVEREKRPENDMTIHDGVLSALQHSQILDLLLLISSNVDEEQYYLNLLEIFSLILREQNPKLLGVCNNERLHVEKMKDTEELSKVREAENKTRNNYINLRKFNSTFVMKGVKSLSNHDVVCHKSLDKVNKLDLNTANHKKVRLRGNRVPVESERMERRSTLTIRLFLKEFCLEFLTNSFEHFMNVVKNKLDSGKTLANDETYYFWALKFFLDFAMASNSDVNLIRNFLSAETFHFVQTSIENAFDHLVSDKKKTVDWIKRIHLILKAYRSLLETLLWMDSSKSALTRSISREVKSQIFYVPEYREMTLHLLMKYDSMKFSTSYLRDLIETTHLFIKLLEDYSKQTKLVIQKVLKAKSSRKSGKKVEEKVETREEKWENIKDDVYDTLCSESCFPEIPPFDAALDIPIDDQKDRAMKKIQKFLLEGNIRDGIGLLRSARQVWPENDYFGMEGMSVEDESMALQEICLADMGEDVEALPVEEDVGVIENENEGLNTESETRIVEDVFDIVEYKKNFVHKKVVEGCGILLRDYKKNSDHTNHCVIKLLHRIGWECAMPAMLFQASLFWTLLKIMQDKTRNYEEINTFTVNLVRKFRKHAEKNPVVFLELLFLKDRYSALEIQNGYEPYEKEPKKKKSKKKPINYEDENTEERTRRKKKDEALLEVDESETNESKEKRTKKRSKKKKKTNQFGSLTGEEDSGESPITVANLSKIFFNIDSESNETTNAGKDTQIHEEAKDEEIEKSQSSSLNNENFKPTETSHEDSVQEKDIRKSQNSKSKTFRRVLLDISDEETTSTEKQLENFDQSEYINDKEKITYEKTFPGEKDSDHSSNSQTSNASSKKRLWEDMKKQTNENYISKSKRIRYIGSDSDVEDFESGDEEPITANKGRRRRRRRLAMIDSESDVEANSLDEK